MLFIIKTRDYHSCLFCHHVSRSRSHLVRLVLFCYFHVVLSLSETAQQDRSYFKCIFKNSKRTASDKIHRNPTNTADKVIVCYKREAIISKLPLAKKTMIKEEKTEKNY